jgi:hypothetical protein
MILPAAILTASHMDIISIMGDEGCNWYVPSNNTKHRTPHSTTQEILHSTRHWLKASESTTEHLTEIPLFQVLGQVFATQLLPGLWAPLLLVRVVCPTTQSMFTHFLHYPLVPYIRILNNSTWFIGTSVL